MRFPQRVYKDWSLLDPGKVIKLKFPQRGTPMLKIWRYYGIALKKKTVRLK